MITDEDRCNVAANIRSAANRRKNDLQDDPDYSPFAALYAVFCGVRGWPHYEDLLHLADLIDIPTCVMTNVGGDFENSFQCSNCMNEFDMSDFDRYPYKRCPECGAVLIDAN